MYLFNLDYLSPQANHDLLHRSEVVALINTLFRFSESLKAVDDFRRIWRNLDSSDTRAIVSESDKITHSDVSSIPFLPYSSSLIIVFLLAKSFAIGY